jgi:hypothetical protein
MRMHMNRAFTAEQVKFSACAESYDNEQANRNHATHPADAASIKCRRDEMENALRDMLAAPSYNGREILIKLEEVLDHTIEWRTHGPAIARDLTDALRPQPSKEMRAAFRGFQKAWMAQALHDLSEEHTESNATLLSDDVFQAVKVVFGVPCATAGDFLVKAYVNLLWSAGHTGGFVGRAEPTGNFFDVSLPDIDSDNVVTDDFYLTTYIDLDESDLGACLLATGKIDFDPAAWVDRAANIGIAISLIISADGRRSLSFGLLDTDDERLQREERRLQRILTFCGQQRWKAVAAFISEHRPQCVLTAPAKAAT